VAGTADGVALERTVSMFKALAHPLRLAIARQIADGDRAVHELVEELGASQPLVSQHLAVLRASDLVSAHRVGREVRYQLVDHHVAHIVADAIAHAAEIGSPGHG
jgi:ArsR family transcriptional regulator, zinc-responsive transcriptional repressor